MSKDEETATALARLEVGLSEVNRRLGQIDNTQETFRDDIKQLQIESGKAAGRWAVATLLVSALIAASASMAMEGIFKVENQTPREQTAMALPPSGKLEVTRNDIKIE